MRRMADAHFSEPVILRKLAELLEAALERVSAPDAMARLREVASLTHEASVLASAGAQQTGAN